MSEETLEQRLKNPAERLAHNQLVEDYYDLTTPYYMTGWGTSHHFGIFQVDETRRTLSSPPRRTSPTRRASPTA